MSMKVLMRSDWRPPLPANLRENPKFAIWLTVVAALQLIGNQAMPQPNCDIVRIAKNYVEAQFPFIHIASKRHVVTSPVGAYWQVTFDFDEPARYLGMVPEITVDPKTCQVVSAKVWQ
jgi:hypothetical protein